jgi:hypothetical protein
MWTADAATAALRTRLGDAETDHYEFAVDITPTPDGVRKQFFVGRTRLVAGTLSVIHSGLAYTAYSINAVKGVMEATGSAPTGAVQASYYWQWFTDAELAAYLLDACESLGYTAVTDEALPVALRSVVVDLAAASAYTRKAAEYAESLSASAPDGYNLTTGQSHPNWIGLAKAMTASAAEKYERYLTNPLTRAKPRLRHVTFLLPGYTPTS